MHQLVCRADFQTIEGWGGGVDPVGMAFDMSFVPYNLMIFKELEVVHGGEKDGSGKRGRT